MIVLLKALLFFKYWPGERALVNRYNKGMCNHVRSKIAFSATETGKNLDLDVAHCSGSVEMEAGPLLL